MSDLAQVNVSRLLAPLDSPLLADFVDALASVNAAGEAVPGFCWRLQGAGGDATDIEAFGWDAAGSHGIIVNLTTWTSPGALVDFVFSPAHVAVMRRRRTWFHRAAEATTALWWVPTGHHPTTAEAEQRVRHLREHGPSAYAFTLTAPFTSPDASAPGLADTVDDRLCPA